MYYFTSESVSPGHPDKLCDHLSDAILDHVLSQDRDSRVACETFVKGKANDSGTVVVGGEITTKGSLDIDELIRKTILEIGYDSNELGFNGNECKIIKLLTKQSPDIQMGVDREDKRSQGAGDQGLMFGYATNETEHLMPSPIYYSHRLVEKQTDLLRGKEVAWLRPDAKSQVTFKYENDKPTVVDTIVLSTQHSSEVSLENLRKFVKKEIILPVFPKDLLNDDTKIFINPTGNFVEGGPLGDSGLTGRKIIVDTYGGMARHGGGAFSGKDPSKVDRSAAYAARYIAKNVVAAGLAERCEIQISYAIGVAEPTSTLVNTFGTGKVSDQDLSNMINDVFDLTPFGIITSLNLLNVSYKPTAGFGHFGRNDVNFTWEQTDKIDILKSAINKR